jgi:phosphopentomutase
MRGEHTVGRVIARPFRGEAGAFERTDGRRDLSIEPPGRSYLEELRADGVPVHSVGKVKQVFAGVGVDRAHPGATNEEAIASTERLIDELDRGLVFANLVETDQVYGHRGDIEGFHGALRRIDAAVGGWLERLDPARDLLVLTADHGCDPTTPGSDHTREHAPLLARFDGHGGRRHDGPLADVGASALRWLTGRDAPALPGETFTP